MGWWEPQDAFFVFVCAGAGGMCRVGEEDTEQPKCAHRGTLWLFGMRGRVRGMLGVCVCVSAGWVEWGGHCNNIGS